MGIYDRDYMRRADGSPRPIPFKPIAIIGVAGLLVLFPVSRCERHHGAAGPPAKGSLRVNVNTASQEELESIPGIRPSRAKSIIDNRPYTSVEDLRERKALGRKMTDDVRQFIKTEGPNEKITPRKE